MDGYHELENYFERWRRADNFAMTVALRQRNRSIFPAEIYEASSLEIVIAREDPRHPDIVTMLRESDAYHARLYPGEINYLMSAERLVRDEAALYGARFVTQTARGLGLGKRLLERIEVHTREHERWCLRLETGRKQHEAISLYHSFGYEEIESFEPYTDDPLSLFMEKKLRDLR